MPQNRPLPPRPPHVYTPVRWPPQVRDGVRVPRRLFARSVVERAPEYGGISTYPWYLGESTRCDDQGLTPRSPADGNERARRFDSAGGPAMPTQQDTDPRLDTTVDATAWTEYLAALDAICNEALIEPHDGGLRTEAVDPANVALVRATLAVDAFADAPVRADPFGVSVPALHDIPPAAETVDLDLDPDTRQLDVTAGPYRYTHATHNPDTIRESGGPPEMELSFEGRLDGDRLREAVQWFAEFGDHIKVGYDADAQTFWMECIEGLGDSVGTDEGRFELDRRELYAVREAGHANSLFSADYFTSLVTAVPEGRPVTVRVGEEFPMLLTYPIYDSVGETCGRVEFMQAPRIQTS